MMEPMKAHEHREQRDDHEDREADDKTMPGTHAYAGHAEVPVSANRGSVKQPLCSTRRKPNVICRSFDSLERMQFAPARWQDNAHDPETLVVKIVIKHSGKTKRN